jgi:hypothetical protein
LAKLGFKEAVDQFLKHRKSEIADSTYRKEKQLLAKPKEFFKGDSCQEASIPAFARITGMDRAGSGVGPVIINMEISAIGRLLKKARRCTTSPPILRL